MGLSHVSEMAFSLNLPLRKAEHRNSPGLWRRLSENGELALALKQLLGQWILEQADFGEVLSHMKIMNCGGCCLSCPTPAKSSAHKGKLRSPPGHPHCGMACLQARVLSSSAMPEVLQSTLQSCGFSLNEVFRQQAVDRSRWNSSLNVRKPHSKGTAWGLLSSGSYENLFSSGKRHSHDSWVKDQLLSNF